MPTDSNSASHKISAKKLIRSSYLIKFNSDNYPKSLEFLLDRYLRKFIYLCLKIKGVTLLT